jgi:rubrerythrin
MTRPIYPDYPVSELPSLAELMGIATALEREAARRFEELAGILRRQGNADTADLFMDLAAEEHAHEGELAAWALRDDGAAPPIREYRWQMPETFDLGEGPSAGATLTPYEALSVAVRNEERAFRFYSYLAAVATDARIRARAEDLAKGELDHVARLRTRRRRAYHAEGRRPRPRPRAGDLRALRGLARGLAEGTWRVSTAAAASLEAAGDAEGAALLRRDAEAARADAEALAAAGTAGEARPTPSAETAERAGRLAPGAALSPRQALLLAVKNAEEEVDTYLDVAAHAGDEAVMAEAQRRGTEAVARLALLGGRLRAGEDQAPDARDGPGA